MAWAGFDRSAFKLARGKLVEFASSPNAIRRFCPRCGTTLTYEKVAHEDPALQHAARIVYVAVATLDDPEAYPPDEVVHGRERIGWLGLGQQYTCARASQRPIGSPPIRQRQAEVATKTSPTIHI